MDHHPAWHSLEPAAVISRLDSHTKGLSSTEAQRRLERYGANRLPSPSLKSFCRVLLSQFISPFIYVLLFAMLLSLAIGNLNDAVFIGIILLANALIGALQEYHAQRSAQALRKLMVNHCEVVRDGRSQQLAAEQLVPGDCVILTSGIRVPADLRLLVSDNLHIDESLLTGESVPVEKSAEAVLPPQTQVAERQNQAFASTLVTSGRGRGLVVSTGLNSEIGRLASQLSTQQQAQPPLLQRIELFSQRLTLALLGLIILLAAVELARGTELIVVFMTVTALAVAAIPEGLPVALTVVLSISMRRMVQRHVVVRKLVATESLGSCTVIATDKTGTLTRNQLSAEQMRFCDGQGMPISGSDTSPTIDSPTIDTIPTGAEKTADTERLQRLCRVAGLCNEASVVFDNNRGEWHGSGDPVDQALLAMAYQLIGHDALQRYPTVAHIHYEPALGFAASLHRQPSRAHQLVCVKGALEKLLPLCTTMAGVTGIEPLDAEKVSSVMHDMAAQGMRILAFADGSLAAQQPFKSDHLGELCLLGLVGMTDPLRAEAKDAIAECKTAGIKICMLTGDHPITALSIGRQLQLVSDDTSADREVVTGEHLVRAAADGEAALDQLTANALIYARVTPEQKLTIVESLIRQGEFVAVTGDGVNDAPALNASHVGIAMGLRGTDVAREASDLLLSDDNFASVVAGIKEGRIAYQNIRKVVFFLISTGAAEMMLFLLSTIFATPMPLTAVQLLWLNLVTSGVQHIGLAMEPGEGDEMQKPPRRPSEALFNPLMIKRVLLSALVVGATSFCCFAYLMYLGWGEISARNSTLLLMVLFENIQVLNSRSESRSVFRHPLWTNPTLIVATLAAQGIHIASMYWPVMQRVLSTTPVTLAHWSSLLLAACSILVVIELDKLLTRLAPKTANTASRVA